MTPVEARALLPGDRIRLLPQSTRATLPPDSIAFVVLRVDSLIGFSNVRITSVSGATFVPWEVERLDGESQGRPDEDALDYGVRSRDMTPIPGTDVYRREFERMRRKVLARDRYRCTLCGSTQELEVHHFLPRARGGTNALTNLVTYCAGCHARVHKQRRLRHQD